jgi:ribosomal protein S1
MRVKGKVTRLQPFGAFVEIAPDVEAVVLSIDHDKRRLSLSMAASKDGTSEDVAEATRAHAAPAKLGTFGDLLSRLKK